jgi:hypothetical protein
LEVEPLSEIMPPVPAVDRPEPPSSEPPSPEPPSIER